MDAALQGKEREGAREGAERRAGLARAGSPGAGRGRHGGRCQLGGACHAPPGYERRKAVLSLVRLCWGRLWKLRALENTSRLEQHYVWARISSRDPN